MLVKLAARFGIGLLSIASSVTSAQVVPARCSCSEPQELADALKPTRSASLMLWNCMCGNTQCVIAHAPSTQAEAAMHCLSAAPKPLEVPSAAPAQDKRGRSLK